MRAAAPYATKTLIATGDEKLPPEAQTSWEIRQLLPQEQALCSDMMGGGSSTLYALHLGFTKANNFKDEKGQPIVLERDETKSFIINKIRPWKEESLAHIPVRERARIATQVLSGIYPEGEEAKNS